MSGANGLHPQARALILLAAALGWHDRNAGDGGNHYHILVAPDGTKLEIPSKTSLKQGVFRGWMRTIVTHRAGDEPDATLIRQIATTAGLDREHTRIMLRTIGVPTRPSTPPLKPDDPPLAPEDPPLAEDPPIEVEPPTLRGELPAELMPELTEPPRQPIIISREQYGAHRGGGKFTYRSKATNKITWSDGRVEFECSMCGAAFDKASSMPGHWRHHIVAGETEPIDRTETPLTGYDPEWTVTPRVRHLANELLGAFDALSRQAPAEELARWIIDRRPHHAGWDEGAELTPEQLLDRIAVLVDRGRTPVLNVQVELLTKQLYEEREHATKLRGNLDALRELMSGEEWEG